MTELTTRERMQRVFSHTAPDRIPFWDTPWAGTISRWKREGMPENVTADSYAEYFGLDRIARFHPDNSPRYEYRVLEQTDTYRIYTTCWGATQKELIGEDTTPEFLDFRVKDRPSWQEAKKLMTPDPARIDWAGLRAAYPVWQRDGFWRVANLWFGFDVTHSWMCGTENILIALLEEPDWCFDMLNHLLDTHIALYEQVLDKGYTFDSVFWWDDMGYKENQFFSLAVYRELIKPVHRRAVEWAHSKGMKAELHSCGDIRPFIPELTEIGLDALNPLEVKAGMNPEMIKETYGDRLVLHGGINALLWNEPDKMNSELTRLLPVLGKNGGYICSTDHSIPNTVSLEQFRETVRLIKSF